MQDDLDRTSGSSPNALVSSADVMGTAVYNHQGEHVGSIDHVMIDKLSGKVAYAVMAFGGVLGIGEEHYPVPWGALRYDVAQGGFVTDVTAEQLSGAPPRGDDWQGDRDWETRTHHHYGIPFYWV